MSDVLSAKRGLSGLVNPYNTDTSPTEAEGDVSDQLTDFLVTKDFAADSAANSTIAQTVLFNNLYNFPVRLVRAVIVTSGAAVTPDANNHATLTLQVDDGANGAPATAGTTTSDSDDANPFGTTADVAEAFTLTGANCTIPPGGNLMFVQAKGGTGVQLPIRTVTCRLRRM
jgi:hypothetical protein